MSDDWFITFAPVLGLAVNVLVQASWTRLFHDQVGRSIIAGLSCGIAADVLGIACGPAVLLRSASTWAVTILTYLALAFGFWAFLNLNITSLRIRLLRELSHGHDHVSRAELLRRYSPEEVLHRRLERLRLGGQLRLEAGRWRISSRTLLRLARSMALLRSVIHPICPRGDIR